MKLERLHEYIIPFVTILGGIALAIKFGSLTGKGSIGTTVMLLAAMGWITICIQLRAKVWLFIPVCWELSGYIPLLDIPLSVRDFAVLLVAVTYCVFFALKVVRGKPRFEFVDLLIFLNIAYLFTVYLRNPVGAQWLGSERVGGRPYFNIFIAFVAYLVISRVPADARSLRQFAILLLVGTLLVSLGSLASEYVPGAMMVLGQFYSGFAPMDAGALALSQNEATGRKATLGAAGYAGVRTLVSYFYPMTFITPAYFWRFTAFVLSMICILLSGFRSSLATALIFVTMSLWFRHRYRDIALLAVATSFVLMFLALANGRLFDLPLSAQRTLSFIPGNWNYTAKGDAEGSTKWRIEMWRMVISEKQWIRDKLLGDGFGLTRHDLGVMQAAMTTTGQGFIGGSQQEAFMIVGAYHNGPLSAIRYAGYVGLGLLLPVMFILARKGARLVRESEGTELFVPALFICLPVIFAPVGFIFMAGAYDNAFQDALLSTGLLKVLERALVNGEKSAAKPQGERSRNPAWQARPEFARVKTV